MAPGPQASDDRGMRTHTEYRACWEMADIGDGPTVRHGKWCDTPTHAMRDARRFYSFTLAHADRRWMEKREVAVGPATRIPFPSVVRGEAEDPQRAASPTE